LPGTDGVEKMSKSLDNYIGLNDSPRDMYGKSLRIPDFLIYTYFELTTNVSNKELKEIQKQLADQSVNPRDLKRRLARTLVTMYHSEQDAERAEQEFDRIFVEKSTPEDIEVFSLRDHKGLGTILALITTAKLAGSRGEARRLIEQGGVSIDGQRVEDWNALIPSRDEFILKVGKRRFLKVIGTPTT
ncbi:MAG: tyrosine--tRNA ligase, partial [Ignavibacteriales bacterium]|nr:tyrosine--tRNA ligase [Ignavibacteriales bacterium]